MPQRSFARNVLTLGGGTALGQALAVIATPIITRLYSPSDMGLFGLFMAFVGTTSVGVALRYEIPIVSVKDNGEADCLLTSALALTVPSSLIAGVILYAMITKNILSYQRLPGWSPAAAACILVLTGAFTSLRYWFVRHGRYDILGRALVLQGFGRAAVPVLLGQAALGWVGLLLGEMVSRILGIGRMVRVAWPALKESVSGFSAAFYWSTLGRNWKSPAILLPSSLIDALAAMAPLPIISYLFSTEAAGYFFLAQRLCSLPAALIATSVADVFHPAIADAYWNKPEDVRRLLVKITRHLGIAAVAIYVPLAILSPWAAAFALGAKWRTAGLCVAVLSVLSMVTLVVSPVSRLLLVVNKAETKLIFDVTGLVVPTLGLFSAHRLGGSFIQCLIVYAVLYAGANVVYYFLIWLASAVGLGRIPRR